MTADDLARVGTRVPRILRRGLALPVGNTPLYLGQPIALLIFEEFDAFDQARLALRDGTSVKLGGDPAPSQNHPMLRFVLLALLALPRFA